MDDNLCPTCKKYLVCGGMEVCLACERKDFSELQKKEKKPTKSFKKR